MADDTDMTADEFLATRKSGQSVQVVKSREEYDDAISLHPMDPEDALRRLMGKDVCSPWQIKVGDAGSVTITNQRVENATVKERG